MASREYERGNGRHERKLAQGTFITPPWAKEPTALALYQINLRKKIHLGQPQSFGHYRYKTNRNKVIRKLQAACCPFHTGSPLPQEMLL